VSAAPAPPAPRLALLGANSLFGKEVKAQLAAAGFPAEAISLFDLGEVAGLLSDYGDEARVVLETVADDVMEHEIVCLCGDRDTAGEYLGRVLTADRLGLDCTGAWIAEDDAFPWIPGITPAPSMTENRALALPQAATLLIGAFIAALGELASGTAASVFLPASELDDAGLLELSQQSTAVMNLLKVDTDIFGRQMAFDMWPPASDDAHDPTSLPRALERLGISVPAINVVAAPVFHGMALSAFVPRAGAGDVADALRNADVHLTDDDSDIDSPLTVVGNAGLHARVRGDVAGCWVWVVADNLHLRATAAVAAILTMTGGKVSGAVQ
jgi:aspartate-semialdehyde dehydrogenase